MIFCYEGEKLCAIKGMSSENVEPWCKRATHKSEENVRRITFRWIMVKSACSKRANQLEAEVQKLKAVLQLSRACTATPSTYSVRWRRNLDRLHLGFCDMVTETKSASQWKNYRRISQGTFHCEESYVSKVAANGW